MRTWEALGVVVVVASGCNAPTVEATPTDAGDDAAATDSSAVSETGDTGSPEVDEGVPPDVHGCKGHDEDLDGVPDECDDCPGIADPDQKITGGVGVFCSALAPFDAAKRRKHFDPFTDFGDWTSFASDPGIFESVGDAIVGGNGADDDLRFIVARLGVGASTTVASTVTSPLGGFDAQMGGILMRAIGDPKRFVWCFRAPTTSGASFGIAIAPASGCDGGPCAVQVLERKLTPAELPYVAGVPDAMLGLRASVTSGVPPATDGIVECRVFDPAIADSEHNADPRYAVQVHLDATQWIAVGEVGLAEHRERAAYLWLDVLTE